MKVLLFIHSLAGGGAERVTATLANHWAREGWDVHIVTLASREQDQFQLDRSVHRTALHLASEPRSLVGGVVDNMRRILALRRIITRDRPDIALSMTSRCNVLLALASVGAGRTVRVGAERTYPPQMPLGAAWEWLRARAYRLLDVIVVQTREAQGWVCEHTSARRVVVIPNPIAWPLTVQDPIRLPQGVGLAGRRRLLTAGRLGPEKRYDALVDVFSRLAPRFRDWELVIVGEGPERQRLESRIDALGLGGVVFLPGHAGNMADWYRAADLYVLTSRFEGFPNALLEAMAHGLPAVSVDCDTGPRDIIRDGIDGLLVPPGGDAELEKALTRVMSDATERGQFARRAIEVRDRFSIDRVHEMWARLFRDLTVSIAGFRPPEGILER